MDVTKACRDTKELSAQAQKACALFMAKCKARGRTQCVNHRDI